MIHNRIFKLTLLWAIFCYAGTPSGESAPSAQVAETTATSRRLNEGWEFVKGDLGGPWEALRGGRSGGLPVWEKVALPHCVNAYDCVDPDTAYYEGAAWYRTFLAIDNPYPKGRTLLHFEGAGQKTDVYVDLVKVGSHVGGYDEFTIDITDAVEAFCKNPVYKKDSNDRHPTKGRIPIAIRCDNSRDLEMIPSDLSDFNVYGGIYRYLNLVYVPAISLERVHAKTTLENGIWKLTLEARLHNPKDLEDVLNVSTKIMNPEGKTILTSKMVRRPWGDSTEIFEGVILNPILWSPSTPNLYRVEVTLATPQNPQSKQVVEERFGLRTFEFIKKGPFHLNGEKLFLRGTHRHEDHAGLGQAMTEELIAQEMRLMKDMGVNFIRLAHYQQSRIVLDLCDSLGILVWEEIPWCRGGLGGETYKQQARDMLRAMIDQHQNHPSVIIWGLGNENDWPGDFEEFDEKKIQTFMRELHDISHELDPTRKTAIRRCGFCSDIIDVYSPSIWAGWYSGHFTEYKAASEREMKKVDHFLHVEWGGDSHARRHAENPYETLQDIEKTGQVAEEGMEYLMTGGKKRASKDGDWSESYICDVFDWHLKEQETMDWLTGTAQWSFKDFSTPLRPENPVPFMNQKGVVERDFTPKEGYYVFQSYWTEKPMIRIYSHSWPVRWGKKGEKKTIKVYSNCTEAKLSLNGIDLGKKKRDSQDFPAAGLRWLTELKEGENRLQAIGYKDGKEVADEITFRYQTDTWGKPARLTLEEISREGDTVTVEAKIFDAKDVQCLDSRQYLNFDLTGDGQLLDNLGTSRGSRKVQAYNGRAMISLLTKGGKSVVSVQSQDCPTQFLIVEAKGKETAKEIAKENFHLYLLIGQSNMAGRGRVEEIDRTPHPRVFTLNKASKWVPAIDPIHFDKSVAGTGLGLSFGKAMADADPSVRIGLIPCAVGGTSILAWQPGATDTHTKTKPYDDALKRAKIALRSGTLKGILWHQGESDANEKGLVYYQDRLTELIERLRHELDAPHIPFVVGDLGDFNLARNPNGRNMNAIFGRLPTLVEGTARVKTSGLDHKGDKTHFNAEGYRELGKRYAEAIIKLQK